MDRTRDALLYGDESLALSGLSCDQAEKAAAFLGRFLEKRLVLFLTFLFMDILKGPEAPSDPSDLGANMNPHVAAALAREARPFQDGRVVVALVNQEAIQAGRGNLRAGIVVALGGKR